MNVASRRIVSVGIPLILLLVSFVRIGNAHDFWLVPDAFRIFTGGQILVRGQTSSRFPTSESAVAPERVRYARILGATEDVRVGNVHTSGTSLLLSHRPRGTGQRIIAVAIAPRLLRASGREFKRYMELEGASALASRYQREGILPKTDSITRRYAKYAKTIVEIGRGGSRAYSRVVGHPAEFVPLDDPASLRRGDTLRVWLLFRGEPLREMHVEAGVAVAGAAPVDWSLQTDIDGVARVPLDREGLWNVRALHILPADRGTAADWDSHFVTLVFEVGTSRR